MANRKITWTFHIFRYFLYLYHWIEFPQDNMYLGYKINVSFSYQSRWYFISRIHIYLRAYWIHFYGIKLTRVVIFLNKLLLFIYLRFNFIRWGAWEHLQMNAQVKQDIKPSLSLIERAEGMSTFRTRINASTALGKKIESSIFSHC